MISASATVGFSNVALVRADDGGSDSGSSSGGDSGSSSGGDSGNSGSSGGSSDSNSGGSNDNGDSSPNDSGGSGDNNNNGNTDYGNNDIGSTEPSKEDPKPVVGEDATKIDPTLPVTTIVPAEPIKQKPSDTGICVTGIGKNPCNPNTEPVKPLPDPKPPVRCIPEGFDSHCNPVKHPGPHCPPGYKVKHGICSIVTVINVHTHNHGRAIVTAIVALK